MQHVNFYAMDTDNKVIYKFQDITARIAWINQRPGERIKLCINCARSLIARRAGGQAMYSLGDIFNKQGQR